MAYHYAAPEVDPAELGRIAQALHHAGAKPFNQSVGFLDQRQRELNVGRVFKIERDRTAPARGDVVLEGAASAFAIDAHDVRTHVGQQHAAKRAGANARELYHLHAVKRS
jgi:hypothetical protein